MIIAPMFNDEDADLILRSKDNVHFRAFKAILKKASSVFSDMFTKPTNVDMDGIQTVDLTEDSETIDHLLRLCYPMQDPQFKNLDQVSVLAGVCEKYAMEDIMGRLAKVGLEPFVEDDPLRVYAISARINAEEVAKQAAFQCLHIPFSEVISRVVPEYKALSVLSWQELLDYYICCTKAADEAITLWDFEWVPIPGYRLCWFTCSSSNCPTDLEVNWKGSTFTARQWWVDYMESIAQSYRDYRSPLLSTEILRLPLPISDSIPCSTCNARYREQLYLFLPHLKQQITKVVMAVEFTLQG